MSQSDISHLPMECTDRYCGIHRDIWRHYEDEIAPRIKGELPASEKDKLYHSGVVIFPGRSGDTK